MPALIKANATILSGNPQLTAYNVSTSEDGSLSITADFVVLAQFAASAYGLFKIGSEIHASIKTKSDVIGALQNYKAAAFPRLTSVSIVTTGGLSTISVTYSGEADSDAGTDANGEPIVTKEVTTTTDLRSLSGSLKVGDENVSFSFDYYATSVTAENDTPNAIPPSQPFNVRSPLSVRDYITTQEVLSRRTYRNNLRQYKESNTITVIYVQSKFL